MFATYDWFKQYVKRLEEVTAADIQRIARTYLDPGNRVVGTYLPTGNGEEE
jgi:predicted Zn-dependent peptidase